MQRLVIMRHAQAESRAASDKERVLSAEGVKEAQAQRLLCTRLGIAFDAVYASPYVRTMQTAGLMHEGEVHAETSLTPGSSCDSVIKLLQDAGDLQTVLVVAHQPDVASWIAMLVSGVSKPCVEMAPGTWALVEFMGACRMGAGMLRSVCQASMALELCGGKI